jgi:hypothetical protein
MHGNLDAGLALLETSAAMANLSSRGPSDTTVAEPIDTSAPGNAEAKSIQRLAVSRSAPISSFNVKPLFEPKAKETSVSPDACSAAANSSGLSP